MNNKNTLLRELPKIDKLIDMIKQDEQFKNIPYVNIYDSVKETIDSFRTTILKGDIIKVDTEEIKKCIIAKLKNKLSFNFKRVINATGTILHTNLGRAVFPKGLLKHLENSLSGYSNLEFNLKTGERGSRYSHIEKLIARVIGAEAALVVNNNAAAVLLCLNEFAKEREVIISRGELVEVGGSFRIPEIMSLSNAKLIEVGTTNRTHLQDYENAITENTSLLLKVHTSNYYISGFTKSVSNKELVTLAKQHNLITMEDLGSGIIIDLSKYGLKKEPTIIEAIKSGIDIVTFSGDKLLGGPQCGIIVGKKELINRLKKNQFLRAFRVCKMTISALEFVFKQYLDEKKAIAENPTINRILENSDEVLKRANLLNTKLIDIGISSEIIATKSIIGGGSMPNATINSFGIAINNIPAIELEKFLLEEEIPIVGRIQNDIYILDLKTIWEDEFLYIVNSLKKFKSRYIGKNRLGDI